MKYLKVWTDFEDVLERLKEDEAGRLFLAMLHYASTGEEPDELPGNEWYVWPVAKRDIDHASDESRTNTENGRKGGRPKTERNRTKPDETEDNRSEPNENQKEKKRKEIEKKGNEKEKIVPLKRFEPPTVDEVALYCHERRNHVDASKFVDYYSSNGWKVGKNPMEDWKAAVRTWERSEFTEKDYQYDRDHSGLPY